MPAVFQCPDGSPPPCASARRAAARRAPPPAQQRARRFLLLPFRNVNRAEQHEWLVTGSPLMLADALGGFQDLAVIPDAQVVAARRRLNIGDQATLDAAQQRRMAEETGGWTTISGNVISAAGTLRVSAQAVDAVTGSVLKRAAVDVPSGGDVRTAYQQLAVQLLEAAGVTAGVGDLTALSTRSLDAYRAYVRGMAFTYQSSFRRAAEAFTEAVTLDSTFALAWARLAAATSAWDIENLVNPFSVTYRASARAAALLPQLPPRAAVIVRGQQLFLRGQVGRARALVDSALAADPDDLEALEMGVAIEMLDPVFNDNAGTVSRRGSFNTAVSRTRRLLELDPGRRYGYSVLGFAYSLSAGLWGGAIPAVRREGASLAAMLGGRSDMIIVHMLRDTFEVMTDSAFRLLPSAEQAALRRRAASAGVQWMEQWLAAGPGDSDAHLWMSRLNELQGNYAAALRHTIMAESLGVETRLENITGRRLTMMLYQLDFERAGALADSLAARGLLRRPFLEALDRGFASGVLALVASGRFERAAAVATAIGPGATENNMACEVVLHPLLRRSAAPPPDDVAQAIIESILAREDQFAAQPVLQPCLQGLRRLRTSR